MMKIVIVSILSILISINRCKSAVIRVPADQPTIQAGIDAAMAGDTVLVADGIYTGYGNRNISFKGKTITVTSENGAQNCCIDCGGYSSDGFRGFIFDSNETPYSVLQGFEIRNSGSPSHGGGIYITYASPTIVGCVVSDNHALESGGGIYCQSSSAIIADCNIFENYARGGIISSGGGIYCENSNITITNCMISYNDARGRLSELGDNGGGLSCNNSSVSISKSMLMRNYAYRGGGIGCTNNSTAMITDSLIVENRTGSSGGGIYNHHASLKITNSTVVNNESGGLNSSFMSKTIVCNCIFWTHTSLDYFDINFEDSSDLKITYSNLHWPGHGVGNVNCDPLFLGGQPFDYHLSPSSPCIDAGTSAESSHTDLDGKPRPQGGACDMGAFEFEGWSSLTRVHIKMPSHMFFPGDLAFCSVQVCNTGNDTPDQTRLFVALDVLGNNYFAPGFSSFDCFTGSFQNGLTEIPIISEFAWPTNAGSASGILWYAALTNPEMTELVSALGIFDFGWSE